jgi:transposase
LGSLAQFGYRIIGDRRTYISEPDRGRRCWKDKPEAQHAVYGNRRHIRGEHGKELLRRRGELLERSFAHAYETGGLRHTHLRGRENILKRVLIHVGGFNLSLVMRQLLGKGTPRGLQGLSADALLILLRFWIAVLVRTEEECASVPAPVPSHAMNLIRVWLDVVRSNP